MNYWLVKSEPDECSIDDFVKAGKAPIRWDGIRNYQARNYLRAMQPGDLVLLYHSSCKQIGVAGVLEVVSEPYDDPLQFAPESDYYDANAPSDNPRWSAVDLRLVGKTRQILTLASIKQMDALQASALVTRPRLSVMPFTDDEWQAMMERLGTLQYFNGAHDYSMSQTPVITFTMNPAVDVFGETEQIFEDSKTRCQQTAIEPGGGGINVARNIRRMGSPTLTVFPSGGLHGEQLQRLLNEDQQPFIAIPIAGNTRQNMAITDLSRHVMQHFVFPGPDLTDKELRACRDTLLKYNAPYLVLSGSLPDHVQQDFYAQVTEAAASAGSKVLLDTSGPALAKTLYHGAYLAKLNRREFASLGFDEHSSVQQLCADMQALVKAGAVEVLIVTLTRGGALMVDKHGRCLYYSAPKVEIVSHVGAGDSFMSAVTHQLVQGAPLEQAFKYGVAAACVTVQCAGNQLEDLAWLERTLDDINEEPV